MKINELLAARKTLADDMDGVERDSKPGPDFRSAYRAAMNALGAFDAKHPEVHAEIMRRENAKRPAYRAIIKNAPSPRPEDVYGDH